MRCAIYCMPIPDSPAPSRTRCCATRCSPAARRDRGRHPRPGRAAARPRAGGLARRQPHAGPRGAAAARRGRAGASAPGRSTVVALDLPSVREARAVVAAMHELAVREAVAQLTAATSTRCAPPTTASPRRSRPRHRRGAGRRRRPARGRRRGGANRALPPSSTSSPRCAPGRAAALRLARRGASVARHERLIELCAGRDARRPPVAFDTWQNLADLIADPHQPAPAQQPATPAGDPWHLDIPAPPADLRAEPGPPPRPAHRPPRRRAQSGPSARTATPGSPTAATRPASSSTSSPTRSPRAPTPWSRSAATSPTTPARSPPSPRSSA